MKIAVAGTGYVGFSLGVLLAQKHTVVAFDISAQKVDMINNRQSPIGDEDIENFLLTRKLNLTATLKKEDAYANADYIIIATPTNYDIEKKEFDTTSVVEIIKDAMKISPNSTIVVKSTVPLGFISKIKHKYNIENIFYSPEFLREGKSLSDNLNPSRIIIGGHSDKAKDFGIILKEIATKKDVSIIHTNSIEAEAIKLFSNTYLAMRVAYFNELDSYCEANNLNSKEVIKGVCMDPRIGNYYNNPSFGYGGYCLPKDTKQLLANYEGVPQNIIKAIVQSNDTRMDFIVSRILSKNPKVVGVYRLEMKKGSDNWRDSSILGVIMRLQIENVKTIIFEPKLNEDNYKNSMVNNNLADFKKKSDIIIANRYSLELEDVIQKLYTRDIFNSDN